MSKIADNISKINIEIEPYEARLIAVSKTKPGDAIQEAYDHGHRDFGENKVQEMTEKHEQLPSDIRWHMIGHLQRNKVKYIAPYVYLIHSIDSERLLKAVDKEAVKSDRIINCLLQVHIAEEESKFGFDEKELKQLLDNNILKETPNVRVVGLMGMATNTENEAQIIREFTGLKMLFDELQEAYQLDNFNLKYLSMGMSGDYQIALDCGSNMVRIGSTIFGERNYV
ncbi:YggS family pyridoxal phosphate-dependent enzyme [Marinoscillum pacificum]|uniref:YggS family pyridoxal phosphate-dependent enzyme n=1 Tax=Marinoscillum pacificum TaxID=392723 RepID=UPI002157C0F1|nr:YggS family pyridoxal phosphate-dependent enzyme [Marinoscillum pacificum]